MSGGSTSGQPGTTTVPGVGTFSAPTTAGTNIGGLAASGKFTVDVHNLPVALTAALVRAGVTDLTQAPAETVRQVLATLPSNTPEGRNAIATLQQMLWFSNQYDPSKVNDPSQITYGRLGPNDLTAIKNVIDLAGQTQQPLGDYLVTSANIGKATGIINGYTGKPQAMQMPAPLDEDAALRSAATSLLQRDPTAKDMADFRAFYDQLTVQANKKAAIASALQAQQGNQSQAEALGGALNTIGQGFGDQPEAPPVPAPPASIASPLDLSGQRQNLGNDYARGPSGITTAQQNQAAQQAAAAYYNQQTSAQNTADSALAQAKAGMPTDGQLQVAAAPSASAAAESFLRQRYGAEIAQNDAFDKYSKLLAFMKGGG